MGNADSEAGTGCSIFCRPEEVALGGAAFLGTRQVSVNSVSEAGAGGSFFGDGGVAGAAFSLGSVGGGGKGSSALSLGSTGREGAGFGSAA